MRTLEADVVPFDRSHTLHGAELVRVEIGRLRSVVPALAGSMTRTDIAERLDWLVERRRGLAAMRNGGLIGFLGWIPVDDFRGTGRRAAYCPAWGHTATAQDRERIYHLLYRAASRDWTAAGCSAHAICLLAHDRDAKRAWCWNGFGVTVIDAIRAIGDVGRTTLSGVTIRRAEPTDLDAIVELETEHWRHYTQPPMLMPARTPAAAEIRDVLRHPTASYWLAIAEHRPIGFLRFQTATEGASDLVDSTTTIAISGAFVRPSQRGRGIATGLLNSALLGYSTRGYDRCSVDFESFNPEASSFWLRSFTPVCISMVRYPELAPETAPAH